MLAAVDFWLQEPQRAVIAGNPDATETRTLLRAVHSIYQPNKVVLGNTGPVHAFDKALLATDGPLVYLCTGTVCQPPTKDPGQIAERLRGVV
jgi:uncharacterized protein YyaL (SSP411 family)